jgi:hypothetical protein
MSHPKFLGLGLFSKFLSKKAVEKYFFDRFFDATTLDMTWLKTQSLRLYWWNTNFHIITKSLNSGWLMFVFTIQVWLLYLPKYLPTLYLNLR